MDNRTVTETDVNSEASYTESVFDKPEEETYTNTSTGHTEECIESDSTNDAANKDGNNPDPFADDSSITDNENI
jgi:hypothetical protein